MTLNHVYETRKSTFQIFGIQTLTLYSTILSSTSFKALFVGLNHICHLRIKVASKVAKLFSTLLVITWVKIELQKSNLHQINHLKVYFVTCFMQNIQKLTMVGCIASNV